MAADLLQILVRANLAAAAAILLVLILRPFALRQFGARAAYLCWIAVPAATAAALTPARPLTVTTASAPPNVSAVSRLTEGGLRPVADGPGPDLSLVLIGAWIVGTGVSLVLLWLRHQRFLASLGGLQPSHDAGPVMRAGASGVGPAVIGFVRPVVVTPADFEHRFTPQEQALILAHERQHIAAGDSRLNALVALVVCVNWFNPLIHLAAALYRTDQELACDAAVVRNRPDDRRLYAEALLKAQIAVSGAPLGCQWTSRSAHPLRRRIDLLSAPIPTAARRLAGVALALFCAIGLGCAAWAAQPPRLVEAGPVIAKEHKPSKLDRKLLRAARLNKVEAARALLAQGANADARSSNGHTPLIEAAIHGDLAMLKLLLGGGANTELSAPSQGTPLMVASRHGHLALVETLIAHGANVNVHVSDSGTPLAAAVRTNHLAVVKTLVEHGADVNFAVPVPLRWRWRDPSPHSPLQTATINGDPHLISYLKSRGANP